MIILTFNHKLMKTTTLKNILFPVIIAIVLAVAFSLNAFATEQNRVVKNFTKVEISGGFDVTLTQGNAEKLIVEAEDEILPKIITEVKGSTLVISLEKNTSIQNKTNLKINLTFVNLDMIDLSGAVKITGTNAMKFSNLEIEGSGATEINLNLSATRLDCDMSGASKITLTGNSPEFDIDLSGASNLDAEEFKTKSCKIESSGASKARIFATDSFEVSGSGASSIYYAGNPASVKSDLSGASKLRKI